ncbi:hypothetical protein AB0K89_13125 [Streptomyces cinnamoneus]|uniref:hypothetical protein n=1 Tax=Streptomyces cinnamoneus TaxID=53446 RepID=UPI003429669B
MRAHRTTRSAVAVTVAALALTATVTGTAGAAAPGDVDIETCLSGGGFPGIPGDDFDGLDEDKPLTCVGGSHDGEAITLGRGAGRGDRPTGKEPLPGFENGPSSGQRHRGPSGR